MKPAPLRIPHYDDKFNYLICRKNNKYAECQIAKDRYNMRLVPVDCLHHAGIHNTETNRKLYPLLVHSILNLIPVNNSIHLKNGDYGKKPETWTSRWQQFLSKEIHKKCCHFVNTTIWLRS